MTNPAPEIAQVCARCQAPIQPGQAHRSVIVHQATGATPDLILHTDPNDCGPVSRTRNHLIRRNP